MRKIIRIGTRESQLAVWQAEQVRQLLAAKGYNAELVYIKSEGDIDLVTPLYEMGVQGIFTRSLDFALLNNRVDLAVHSLKDVPTQLPQGLSQAAVLKRGPVNDLLVYKGESPVKNGEWEFSKPVCHIATSSIRRQSQWLNRFPGHEVHNLRGNVNTRLQKLANESWDGAIFAQAGLERIGIRPENSAEIDWMLPAPAQGAITVVCRREDRFSIEACRSFNDNDTEICTRIERDFLRALLGGCSTPISALAEKNDDEIIFRGNILSLDGKKRKDISKTLNAEAFATAGKEIAEELLATGGDEILRSIKDAVS
jgi:hydroxymethylbilane synthase